MSSAKPGKEVRGLEPPLTERICGLLLVISSSASKARLDSPFSTVSTMFGVVEMAFGVGMIIGPTVGGVLYQAREEIC